MTDIEKIKEILPKDFDPIEEKYHIISWIRKYFKENGPDCKAIIGISGGKDSTIAAALCVEALGRDRVIGVMMPNGEQSDIDDSVAVVKALSIKSYCINIEKPVNALYEVLEWNSVIPGASITTNAPARIRMTTLYAVAANEHGRVCNTCNKSEDYVGYSTKFGDSAGDFSPLSSYTVAEVVSIGLTLGIDEKLILKTPSDGMCGKTDEDNLGFTYLELDNYLLNGEKPSDAKLDIIEKLHNRNLHKVRTMPCCYSAYRHDYWF